MAVVHPEDRGQLRTRQEEAIQEGVPINLEYRMVTPSGDERIMQERGVAQMGKDGAPAQFSGQVLDVTEQKAHEEENARLRADYNDLLAALPEALLVVEPPSLEIVEANEAAASLLGPSVPELLDRPVSSFYPDNTADSFQTLFEEARRQTGSGPNTTRRFADGTPIRVATEAGDEVPVALTLTAVERAERTFFVVLLRNDTQQKQIRERLRTFEQAVAQSGDMIFMTDADGTIQYANPAAESITGYDRGELKGRTPRLLRSGETPEAVYEQLWATLNRGESFRGTFTDERKDGSVVKIEQTITPVQDETGEVSHYVSTGRDVTERIEREARLRGLTNSIPGVVYQFYARPDGTQGTHFVSKHAEPILGIDPDTEDFLTPFLERVPAPYRDELEASIDEALTQQKQWSYEIPYDHPSGERIWLLGTSTPNQHADEVVFNGVLLDITERKEAEQASQEERNRFVTLFESLPTPVLHCELASEGTLITDVNEAFEEVFGVGAAAAEGKDVNDLLVPEGDEAEAERIEHDVLEEETQQFEVRRKTADGVRDFRLQAAGHGTDSDSAELYAIYTDITERNKREQRLRGRRQKIESLYEATSRLLTAEEPEAVFDQVHAVLQEVLDYTVTATGGVKDDRIVFTNVAVTDDETRLSPEPASLTADRVSARAVRTEETVVVDGAEAPRWAPHTSLTRVAGVPIGDHGVVVIGQTECAEFNSFNLRLVAVLSTYAAVVLDRIERERELRAAKEDAENASELKTAMLANMSHEIRTPLTAINGFSEILKGELEAPHDNFAERVYESSQRLMSTFDSVLQLSKLEAGTRDLDHAEGALDRIVGATVEEWRPRAAEKSITLETHVRDSSIMGLWDTEFVSHVAANLLENAIKFTPEGGEVHVHVREEGARAVFEVQDTGIGISEQFRPQMFKAFKQESEGLSREYEGAGLGLAVTKQAVECMGGRIEVETEKNEGSCFTVHLPKDREPLG
ncbi:MAG: PAS domain S-box protein [Salinibacter sp.]